MKAADRGLDDGIVMDEETSVIKKEVAIKSSVVVLGATMSRRRGPPAPPVSALDVAEFDGTRVILNAANIGHFNSLQLATGAPPMFRCDFTNSPIHQFTSIPIHQSPFTVHKPTNPRESRTC